MATMDPLPDVLFFLSFSYFCDSVKVCSGQEDLEEEQKKKERHTQEKEKKEAEGEGGGRPEKNSLKKKRKIPIGRFESWNGGGWTVVSFLSPFFLVFFSSLCSSFLCLLSPRGLFIWWRGGGQFFFWRSEETSPFVGALEFSGAFRKRMQEMVNSHDEQEEEGEDEEEEE